MIVKGLRTYLFYDGPTFTSIRAHMVYDTLLGPNRTRKRQMLKAKARTIYITTQLTTVWQRTSEPTHQTRHFCGFKAVYQTSVSVTFMNSKNVTFYFAKAGYPTNFNKEHRYY